MSYSIDVCIKRVIHSDDYTCNVSEMYYEAWNRIQDKLLERGIPQYILTEANNDGKWKHLIQCNFPSNEYACICLDEMICELKSNPDKYKKLNPENGWGNYEGAIQFLHDAYKALLISEDAYIEFSC